VETEDFVAGLLTDHLGKGCRAGSQRSPGGSELFYTVGGWM
jgi:hypothetical protein